MNVYQNGTDATMAMPTASDSSNNSNKDEGGTFWGHFVAGEFLVGFGVFFLALTVVRLRPIIFAMHRHECDWNDNNNNNNLHHATTSNGRHYNVVLKAFLERHVPEQNPVVLFRISVALLASTMFGFLYEGLGARFLNHNGHPEYETHMTITLLYAFVGWYGWLEWKQVLPQDSLRASLVLALCGEVLIWQDHVSTKMAMGCPVDAQIHSNLALVSGLTAIVTIVSMVLSSMTIQEEIPSQQQPTTTSLSTINTPPQPPTHKSQYHMVAFLSYLGTFLGLLWQGLWFMVAAMQQKWPIASTSHVTVLFILQALIVALLCQGIIMYIVRHTTARVSPSDAETLSPTRLQSQEERIHGDEEYAKFNIHTF